jgi:hypothetical protein
MTPRRRIAVHHPRGYIAISGHGDRDEPIAPGAAAPVEAKPVGGGRAESTVIRFKRDLALRSGRNPDNIK